LRVVQPNIDQGERSFISHRLLSFLFLLLCPLNERVGDVGMRYGCALNSYVVYMRRRLIRGRGFLNLLTLCSRSHFTKRRSNARGIQALRLCNKMFYIVSRSRSAHIKISDARYRIQSMRHFGCAHIVWRKKVFRARARVEIG
jgi:hypothetical protein